MTREREYYHLLDRYYVYTFINTTDNNIIDRTGENIYFKADNNKNK